MPLEPDKQGFLEYICCQYVVMGTPPRDFSKVI